MTRTKSFKLQIDSVVAINTEGLDFSETEVHIKNGVGAVVRSMPLNQLSQAIITIQTQSNLVVTFCLMEPNPMGSRGLRLFAQGKLDVDNQEVEEHQKITMGCSIRNIVTNKAVITLAIIIKQDVEKKTYAIPQSQPSEIFDEDTGQQQIVSSPQISPRVLEPDRQKKPSPLKRAPKKPMRNRHYEYQVKSESSNVQLNNKVTDQQSISVENLKLQLDEAISSIQFYGHTYQQMLAQIMFKTNPSQQDLKNLRIKFPESQKMIDIHLKTIEGGKLFASTNLPNISENECLKISCDFKDENNDIKGKMRFNYKESFDQNDDKLQKMNMAEQISIFSEHKNKKKQKIDYIPFFLQQNRKPIVSVTQQSPRLKLPKLLKKQPKLESLISNEKIKPEQQKKIDPDQKKVEEQYSNRSAFAVSKPSRQAGQSQMSQIHARMHRSKTIHSRSIMRPKSPIIPSESRINTLKIMSISIKFQKSYLQRQGRHLQKQPFTGKFLQIYSNCTQIYRSEPVYSNSTLNWKLQNCHIPITQCDNLTIQLNLQKEKTLLGELVMSYNQLKFNQEQNFLYFGYLTHEYDTIAKICIQFVLQQGGQKQQFLERRTRTRMKRLYSQDIAYQEKEDPYLKLHSNKLSLKQSLASPHYNDHTIKANKYRLCEQQKQIELMRERKRNKNYSPVRRQKLYY